MRVASIPALVGLAITLLLSPLLGAPAGAVEEIVRVDVRSIDCPTHPAGNMLCRQYIHQVTLMNAGETAAGRTFHVYTKDEIDARLKTLTSMAAEIERLKRQIAEIAPVCARD
jgi:hypothetical protein